MVPFTLRSRRLVVSQTLVLLASPLLASCGRPAGGQRAQTPAVLEDGQFLDDPGCQSGEGVGTIASETIYQYNGSESEPVQLETAGLSSAGSLSGSLISGTEYGFHQRASCSGATAASCGEPSVVTPPRELEVCRSNAAYQRGSLENVALTSLVNIERAYAFYNTLDGHQHLTHAKLLVFPLVEQDFAAPTPTTKVVADNLAYTPDFSGTPAFVIYPRGTNVLWQNLNLWEAPWTLAHEFGHHVFTTHTHLDHIGEAPSLFASVLPGFDQTTPFISPVKVLVGKALARLSLPVAPGDFEPFTPSRIEQDAADPAQASIAAVNEGYADLFAYYALGGVPGDTSHIDCFDTNRDTSAASFADGRPKRMDQGMLDIYYGRASEVAPSSCQSPSFVDSHAIGAVIAYGLDEVFSGRARVGSGDTTATTKAALLLRWADMLGAQAATAVSADDIGALLLPALKVATSDGQTLSAAQCQTLRTVFPAYIESWLSGINGLRCAAF